MPILSVPLNDIVILFEDVTAAVVPDKGKLVPLPSIADVIVVSGGMVSVTTVAFCVDVAANEGINITGKAIVITVSITKDFKRKGIIIVLSVNSYLKVSGVVKDLIVIRKNLNSLPFLIMFHMYIALTGASYAIVALASHSGRHISLHMAQDNSFTLALHYLKLTPFYMLLRFENIQF
jgi:hypothetical protein